jgi:hypothetical protein
LDELPESLDAMSELFRMQVIPAHPDSDTHTPGLRYPHTRTQIPTHPDSDTHTPAHLDELPESLDAMAELFRMQVG